MRRRAPARAGRHRLWPHPPRGAGRTRRPGLRQRRRLGREPDRPGRSAGRHAAPAVAPGRRAGDGGRARDGLPGRQSGAARRV